MHTTLRCVRRGTVTALIACGLALMSMTSSESLAQKKKATTKQDVSPTEQQAPTSVSKASGMSMKEFLSKFRGSRTSLGLLMRLEADHFITDDDGTVTVYAYSAIRSIKILKVEDGEENPILLDITLL
jgi:hypothetical protein